MIEKVFFFVFLRLKLFACSRKKRERVRREINLKMIKTFIFKKVKAMNKMMVGNWKICKVLKWATIGDFVEG